MIIYDIQEKDNRSTLSQFLGSFNRFFWPVVLVLALALIIVGISKLGAGSSTHVPVTLEYAQANIASVATTSLLVVPAARSTYVASKNGTTYYLPWCPSVKRILEKNKIWFDSKEAAEKAGFRPAQNCKGL
jgi:preprotein translocase subunit SecY